MSKIAIFSGPYPVDDALGGVGLRLWEVAELLSDAGHEVVIAAPRESDFTHPHVCVDLFTESGWPKIVDWSDVVMTTDLPDTRILLHAHQAGKAMIVENAPPIEHLHYKRIRQGDDGARLYRDVLVRWRLQLLLADHLVVRSEAERAATLGALVHSGRIGGLHDPKDPGLRRLLSVVPIGFTHHAAERAATAAPVGPQADLVWNGGVWDYCAPDPVLDAMAAARNAGNLLTLRIMYPCDHETNARLDRKIADLALTEQVQWPREAPGHRRRDGYMKSVRVMVITGGRTAENMTCHRLRLRDASLYQLPVVVDHYGASADLVAVHGIGAVIDPNDADGLATALVTAAQDGRPRSEYLRALNRNRSRFELENHVTDLLRFLDNGHRAPDVGSPGHARTVEALVAANPVVRDRPPRVL